MLNTGNFTSLNLDEAAEFLGLHPDTLQQRAKAKLIPGNKEGKEWRFYDVDLIEYVRSQYQRNEKCLSTKEKEARIGGMTSPPSVMAEELENQLERLISAKRKKSTSKSARK